MPRPLRSLLFAGRTALYSYSSNSSANNSDDDTPEHQLDISEPPPPPSSSSSSAASSTSSATTSSGSSLRPAAALTGSGSGSTAASAPRFRAPGPERPALSHKPHGFVYVLLRWPVLFLIGTLIFIELLAYLLVRWVVATYELAWRSRARRALADARSYEEWRAAATELDRRSGAEEWKAVDRDPFYDSDLIASLSDSLAGRMERGDTQGLVRDLLEGCKNNLGGIENEQLYSCAHLGTKRLVEEHVVTVCEALEVLGASPDVQSKGEIFRRLGKSYGRTALCLSGGASFGYYHLGVIRALLKHGVLPKVISGTSAGALMASFVSVRTDEELLELLLPSLCERFQANDEPVLVVLRRFLREGVLFDLPRWEKKMQVNITKGNTTFLEAYQATGRILNISVAAEEKFSPPLLLNYKTTPNVVIWSAVLASAAVPGILHAVELQSKNPDGTLTPYRMVGRRWRDGVLRADIPYAALKQLFGVSYTVVSQVNPHVVPFFFHNRGSGGSPTLHRGGRGWRGGFVLSMLEDYLRLDMRKWLQLLHNLNLLPRIFGQDWTMVFLQNFTGDVTVVPRFRLPDYVHTISDPDYEGMRHYIEGGEKNAWPKLAMIANRVRIEQALDRLRELYPTTAAAEGGTNQSAASISILDLPKLE